MNCKPDIVAFIVVPSDWPSKKLDNKVVEVVYLRPSFADPTLDQRPTWWCKFPTPWFHNDEPVHECWLLGAWLRPISGVPLDEEAPAETNVTEALRLALVIQSRWSA